MKALVWIGMLIGSTLGGAVPLLWHAGFLSASSLVGSTIGGIAGIWVGYKIGSR